MLLYTIEKFLGKEKKQMQADKRCNMIIYRTANVVCGINKHGKIFGSEVNNA